MFNIRIAAEIVRHQLWIAIFAFIGKKLKMIAPDTKGAHNFAFAG